MLAYSWNLIGGYAGYTHFGQISFFGIGAYVGSLLIFHWDVPWYLARDRRLLRRRTCCIIARAAPCCG